MAVDIRPVAAIPLPGETGFDIVLCAASVGGPRAYIKLLADLPASFAAPIVLVQHRPAWSGPELPTVLGRRARLPVVNAADQEPLVPGCVFVVPANATATISRFGRLTLAQRDPGARAADALFSSAAAVYGPHSIGVILTGTLNDGAEGVRAIKAAGGTVLVQEPASAQAPGMPNAALATGCVDHALPLERISSALTSYVMVPGAAALFAVPPPHWARLPG